MSDLTRRTSVPPEGLRGNLTSAAHNARLRSAARQTDNRNKTLPAASSPYIELGPRAHGPAIATTTDFGLLLLLWLLVCWLIGVHGNFPINDDWSYAVTVQRLLDEGAFRPTGWTSMPLLTHTLWGALFCLPNGHSAEALRMSTLAMGYLGLIATYGLMREVGAGRRLSLFAASIVACNPLYVALAFTYMTDLPFVAMSVTALWLFARSLRTNSRTAATIATVVMVLAILNRQLGLFVGIGFAAALLRRDGWSLATALRAVLPLSIGVAVLVTFEWSLRQANVMPIEYAVKTAKLMAAFGEPAVLLRSIAEGTFLGLAYVGLFTLPMLLMRDRPRNRVATAVSLLTLATMTVALINSGRLMPLGFNVMTAAGIGPDTLRDVYLLKEPNQHNMPVGFWLGITALSLIGAAHLVARLTTELHRMFTAAAGPDIAVRTMLLFGAAAYSAPILSQTHIDRYLLVFVPIVGALVMMPDKNAASPPHMGSRSIAATAAFLPLILLAIVGTHDWMERTRTRWHALDWIENDLGIEPTKIDGGFEYNGSRNYDETFKPVTDHSWWWVHDAEYIIAMGPLPGYRELRTFAVNNWLPQPNDNIVVLQRDK